MKKIFIASLFSLLIGAILVIPSLSHAATPGNGTLVITLPSKELLVPNQLQIASSTFNFSSGTGQFSPTSQNGYTVAVTTHDTGTRSEGYVITVDGVVKGGGQFALKNQKFGGLLAKLENLVTAKAYSPPPAGLIPTLLAKTVYPYKLTFAGSLAKTTVTSFASYLQGLGNNRSDTYLSDESCVAPPGNTGTTTLCMQENVTFNTTERGATGPLYLMQAVPLGTTGAITIQGNAAAYGTVDGFSFNNLSNAFAIGGNIPGSLPNASKQLVNYINQYSTKFAWTQVQSQITSLFNKRSKGTTYTQGTLSGSTWYLNAAGSDPTSSTTNSFSTPPEGKLWNVNSDLTLPAVNFNGSGTIVVQGNVTFNGNVTCTPGTRLGVIAGGSITFNGSTIGCGAYTAGITAGTSQGNIKFNFQVASGNPVATGIFVARDSIDLPSLGSSGSYSIQYDNLFATNPTTLYQQLLQVIFSTSS